MPRSSNVRCSPFFVNSSDGQLIHRVAPEAMVAVGAWASDGSSLLQPWVSLPSRSLPSHAVVHASTQHLATVHNLHATACDCCSWVALHTPGHGHHCI